MPGWFSRRAALGAPPFVFGVKMEYALKGDRREYPKGSGQYFYSNPLIRPWKKASISDTPVEGYSGPRRGRPRKVEASLGLPYAINWDFRDDLGANHTLGKGWRPVNIWEDMGVKAWIEVLASESIQGLEPGASFKPSLSCRMNSIETTRKRPPGSRRRCLLRNETRRPKDRLRI